METAAKIIEAAQQRKQEQPMICCDQLMAKAQVKIKSGCCGGRIAWRYTCKKCGKQIQK